MTPGSAITADTYATPPAVCGPHGARQHADGVHAVLESDDDGLGADERRQQRERALGVVQLHREEDDVDGTDRRGIVGGVDAREVGVALRALNPEAARAQRLEVRAAREKRDVGAGGSQTSAEIAADAAAADDRDAHEERDRSTLG